MRSLVDRSGLTFEEIYTKHSKQVYNLALHYVQNTADAEEITQDVFVAIHRSLHKFDGRSALSTWIYRITINKSLDFIKTQKRRKNFGFLSVLFYDDHHEARHGISHADHPGIIMEQKEAVQRIFDQINRLPPNQKTALILSKIEHKSQTEISEIMNMSPKAVESLIQRAKTNLAKNFGPREGK